MAVAHPLILQEGVLALDALGRDRALSCGGRDRSVRLWKVVEESHAIFAGQCISFTLPTRCWDPDLCFLRYRHRAVHRLCGIAHGEMLLVW